MGKLPNEMKLTGHARLRLEERNKENNYYDTRNLMKSSVKWYGKDDLIHDCALYRHCCYTTRKSTQMGYITDGNIEVIYNKGTKTAITILEVKEKFLPITQYIKPEVLKKIEIKKENKRKMKTKLETGISTCPDCGQTGVEVTKSGIYAGLCRTCKTRKQNMKNRGREYIPYKDLSEEEKTKIDNIRKKCKEVLERQEALKNIVVPGAPTTIPMVENYYQVKAEQNPAIAQVKEIPIVKTPSKDTFDPLSDSNTFASILNEYGCSIPKDKVKDVLDVLMNIGKLKELFTIITENDNSNFISGLDVTLDEIEQKLRYDWENNGFQETDDIKFKGFLVWRKTLKDSLSFWKKLSSTNAIAEIQKVWDTSAIPNVKSQNENTMKKYQITTETVSTILNTRRQFTRVFYAPDENTAHEMLKQWLGARQLHEDSKKTTIVELKNEGEDGRNG